MAGCIVQVWFEAETENADRHARFNIVETECRDFATFCKLVEADRLIGGARLWTRNVGDGKWIITRRLACAFRGSAVVRCQLPAGEYYEAESDAQEAAE